MDLVGSFMVCAVLFSPCSKKSEHDEPVKILWLPYYQLYLDFAKEKKLPCFNMIYDYYAPSYLDDSTDAALLEEIDIISASFLALANKKISHIEYCQSWQNASILPLPYKIASLRERLNARSIHQQSYEAVLEMQKLKQFILEASLRRNYTLVFDPYADDSYETSPEKWFY